jgi:hypothetical protein
MRGTFRKFKSLPEGQRQQLRRELHELRDLQPKERERRREELHRKYFPEG